VPPSAASAKLQLASDIHCACSKRCWISVLTIAPWFAPDSALEGDGFEPSVPRQIRCRFHDGSPVSHEGLTVTQTRNHEFEFVSLQRRVRCEPDFRRVSPCRGQVLRPDRAVVNEIVAMIAEANKLSVR
jgi:hypothetical protein